LENNVKTKQEIIGNAEMRDDGTIVLDLFATTDSGARGMSQLVYPPNHAQYSEILNHLGGLKPGEKKGVPPWPEK
jgi:hypothetical protein